MAEENKKRAYQLLLEEHNLTVSELSEDAQVGISAIKEIEHSMMMVEKKGQVVKPKVLAKLKVIDRWVSMDILDQVNHTEENEGELPIEPEEVAAIVNELTPEEELEKAGRVEKQLSEMLATGKVEFTSEEISPYRDVFDDIFENYKAGELNGVETTNYKLIESDTKPETFTLTKK